MRFNDGLINHKLKFQRINENLFPVYYVDRKFIGGNFELRRFMTILIVLT